MKILVTGAAGFIGSTLSHKLCELGHEVLGIDNLNDYYDPTLKLARLERLKKHKTFGFEKLDVADREGMDRLFHASGFDKVVHLAAQAGVRYSIQNPHVYIDSNVKGYLHILEGVRHNGVKHLVYASTSSVYGLNEEFPLSEHQGTAHQVSLYAATKKANEMMAHSYSQMYGIPTTGVRFFTVYGPWGRPDMALFLFTKNILAGEPIHVFNGGRHKRDFTYVDDIVAGITAITLGEPPARNSSFNAKKPDPAISAAPYRIYNIGNGRSVELMRYIELLEDCLGKKAEKIFEQKQLGDVDATWADITDLRKDFNYDPQTPVEMGIKNFVSWYREYFKV